jgi:hypothetical protein
MRISMLLALSFVFGCVSNVLGQGGDVKPLSPPKTIRVQEVRPISKFFEDCGTTSTHLCPGGQTYCAP